MLLNTRFFVDKQLDRRLFLKMLFEWLSTSDNYHFALESFDFTQEEKSFESSDGSQKFVINNYDDRFIAQIILESDDSIFTTNFVLDDKSDTPSLHLSLNKTMTTMSLYKDKATVRLPSVIRSIFWEELGGMDNELLTDNKAYLLRKNDAEFISKIVTQQVHFLNPVVYVSANRSSGLPLIDCNLVAQDLMGQAHVVVESSPLVNFAAKNILGDDKDLLPSDGVVKIILPNGESRVMIKREGGNFDYAIINCIRKIMADVNIEDSFNVNKIRQAHIFEKLSNSEDKELYQICEQMLNDKDHEIESLNSEISDLKKQLHIASVKAENLQNGLNDKNNAENNGENYIHMSVGDENEMYDGEIVDVILRVLQKEYDSMKDDETLSSSRKFDVLGGVLEHNFPCTTGTELSNCIKRALKDGTLTGNGIGCLQAAGFVVEKQGRDAHYKVYLKGFEKYAKCVASTPSEKYHGPKNAISDFCNMLFGY